MCNRHKGSITYELKQEVNKRVNENSLKVLVNKTMLCNALTPDLMLLNLDNGDHIGANYIVLATGYDQELPGGKLVQSLISKYDLACAECGFPITDSHLKWHDKVYVSGALAELEVGPVSRNIIGARMAADKIINSQKVQKQSQVIN